MFVRQNQQQFRNSNADVNFFYPAGSTSTNAKGQPWNKPPGISHIYIMLIGAGGQGDGTNGGGSGAVTVWYGAAQNVPDSLIVSVSNGSNTYVYYRSSSGTLVTLLQADTASSATGGAAMTANQFSNMGFFQSVAGQAGSSTGTTASATTFLSGGGAGTVNLANYGYSTGGQGFFRFSPIMVGVGTTFGQQTSNYGCGGDNSGVDKNGGGLALIASW